MFVGKIKLPNCNLNASTNLLRVDKPSVSFSNSFDVFNTVDSVIDDKNDFEVTPSTPRDVKISKKF